MSSLPIGLNWSCLINYDALLSLLWWSTYVQASLFQKTHPGNLYLSTWTQRPATNVPFSAPHMNTRNCLNRQERVSLKPKTLTASMNAAVQTLGYLAVHYADDEVNCRVDCKADCNADSAALQCRDFPVPHYSYCCNADTISTLLWHLKSDQRTI